jgi:hypothetical protein
MSVIYKSNYDKEFSIKICKWESHKSVGPFFYEDLLIYKNNLLIYSIPVENITKDYLKKFTNIKECRNPIPIDLVHYIEKKVRLMQVWC